MIVGEEKANVKYHRLSVMGQFQISPLLGTWDLYIRLVLLNSWHMLLATSRFVRYS
jgi:hypothetical protein